MRRTGRGEAISNLVISLMYALRLGSLSTLMSVELDVWSRLDEDTDGADGADDRGDEDGDDCTDVTEGVSLGARANGFPPAVVVSLWVPSVS